MVLHFLKEDALNALKMNVGANLKHYSDPTNEWIYDFFDGDNPFAEYKVPVEDFQLMTAMEKGEEVGKIEVENTIRLYSAMRGLTDSQATDERLWAGLTHGDCWDYMYMRWKGSDKKDSAIINRYFFYSTVRQSLFRNALAKLWWLGRVTYDQERKDAFELTRYLENDFGAKILMLFTSNFTGNPCITRGLLSALMQLEKEKFVLPEGKRAVFTKASRFLNVYGGTHILDYYSEEEIREKVLEHMYAIAEHK